MRLESAATTRRQVRKNEKRQKEREKESLKQWQELLTIPAGRYVLLELIEWCSVFRSLPVEPHLLQRSAGVQLAGQHILQKIAEAAPGHLAALLAAPYLREAQERIEREIADNRHKPAEEDEFTEDT